MEFLLQGRPICCRSDREIGPRAEFDGGVVLDVERLLRELFSTGKVVEEEVVVVVVRRLIFVRTPCGSWLARIRHPIMNSASSREGFTYRTIVARVEESYLQTKPASRSV